MHGLHCNLTLNVQFNCAIKFNLEVHFKYEWYKYHTLQEKYVKQGKLTKYKSIA